MPPPTEPMLLPATEDKFRFGASACFNQIAMAIVQVVMNNTLSRYGAQSVYGGDIPLACSGIISKVNMIFMAIVIGISQGTQPIIGFNTGKMRNLFFHFTCTMSTA